MVSRFHDVAKIECEHGIAEATVVTRDGSTAGFTAFVKVRVMLANGDVGLGQILPAEARQLANQFIEVAGRAEYEQDFARAAEARGLDGDMIAMMLSIVREGEQKRMEERQVWQPDADRPLTSGEG